MRKKRAQLKRKRVGGHRHNSCSGKGKTSHFLFCFASFPFSPLFFSLFSSPFHLESVMDLLSGTDASGRQISLLNVNKQALVSSYGSNASSVDEDSPSPNHAMSSTSPYSSDNEKNGQSASTQVHTKRKYHCREPGCDKSFTTR